jgi:CRISPR system Cascade subunit CasB
MNYEHDFVTYLGSLRENRGALAALRRGLGHPPGDVPDMFRYIVPKMKAKSGTWTEKTHYLIASLFALHPVSISSGNIGNHFARHLDHQNPENNTALERRFTILLTARPDDLHIYLRQAISFLKSKDETPVNWHRLMWDILALGNPEKVSKVQKRWAEGFWRPPQKDEILAELEN